MGLINQTAQSYYDTNIFGNYQFTSLSDIINQFMVVYVGEEKTISKAKRVDVAFHAQRALQELSFDTLKSIKAQEITVPATLQMPLPQDYVNYTKISWVDSAGIKHVLYPTSKTSNPSNNPLQDANGDFTLQAIGDVSSGAATGIIPLDAEYKDITVGMRVTGFNIPNNTFVKATSNSGGITTITLGDGSGTVVLPIVPYVNNNGITLTFTNSEYTGTHALSGSLVKPQSIHIVENINWIMGDNQVTGHTGYDFSNIEIGMVVSSEYFPKNTTVTNIYEDTISFSNTLSANAGIITNGSGELTFIDPSADTDTWSNYKSGTPSENQDDYQDDTYWPMAGNRYGLDSQYAQANGSFYIDEVSGKIHFSSNISGKTVILDYISDSLGTDAEMQVHKFAEEAMYKSIAYAILSTRANTPEYIVRRFKKERFAAIRTAKLRLSNIKLEEITQTLRGKSKQIKH